jgi:hypothetical protein
LCVNDSALVDLHVQQLLGQGSIALAKSQQDRCLEFLGWDFYLDTQTITLCVRNMNKLVHALFSFHPTGKISVSRVSIKSRHMRPYTHTLHAITSGYTSPHVKILLSDLAQSDIMMWRAFVLLLIANPSRLSRPMESFRQQPAQYIIKYDASLTGLGVGLYEVQDSRLLIYTALQLPFDVDNDSSNQNTMEFVAVVLVLLLAWRLKLTQFHPSTISMHLNATLSETEHIPGSMNILFDGLSRNVSPEDLGLDPLLMFQAAADEAVNQFIQLCNPSDQLSDMMSHTTLLRQCTNLLML